MMRYKNSFCSLLGAMVALLSVAPIVQAQNAPANDNFANSILLPGDAGSITGTNVGATRETGEPSRDGVPPTTSVWYRWKPTTRGTATFSTARSTFDTVLGIHRGSSVNALTTIAANDQFNGNQSLVRFPTEANAIYYIAVDGYFSSTGAIQLSWNLVPSPVNDNFASSILLEGTSDSENGTTTGASTEAGEPDHAGSAGGSSIWYRWRPANSGTVTLTTAGSSIDTTLAVYLGLSVGTLTNVTSNDDVSTTDTSSSVRFLVEANTTYYIAVDSALKSGRIGAITLNLSQVVDPTPRYTVSGTVKTDLSQSLGDVIISLSGADSSNSRTTATATTNASGVFTISNLLAGNYILRASKRGYTLAPERINVAVTGNASGNDFTATLIPVPDLPSVSVSDVEIREGNRGDSFLTFNVSLNRASKELISVSYQTLNGTAISGSDYNGIRGNLLFAPGTVTIGVNIRLRPDTSVEENENFLFKILGATGANVADETGTATILNDDKPVVVDPSARSAKIQKPTRLALLDSHLR